MSAEIKEVPAVREETRPTMGCGLSPIDRSNGNRRTTGRGNAIDGVRRRRGKDDRAIVVPTPSTPRLRSAQRLSRATGSLNSSQITLSKKANRTAIGRPERECASLSACQRCSSRRVDPPYEENSGVSVAPCESDAPTVRRHHGWTGIWPG